MISRNTTIILIYHRHKLTDLICISLSLPGCETWSIALKAEVTQLLNVATTPPIKTFHKFQATLPEQVQTDLT
jgi:hypothetical protein